MQAIFEIDVNRRTPKYQQIANSITKAIRQGKIKRGDRILSINELSNEFMLSRDTVQKAYYLLEKEQILQAVRGKGFYINRTDVFQRYKVLLIFDVLDNCKQLIFDGFVKTLGNLASVDVKIYQNDQSFAVEIQEALAEEYDYYIVMPDFREHHPATTDVFKRIPADKLVVLDKGSADQFPKCNAVYDDFEKDFYIALHPCRSLMSRYHSLFYIHAEGGKCGEERMKGFKDFCVSLGLNGRWAGCINKNDVVNGHAFIIKDEKDLIEVIKIAEEKGLVPGLDVGIISLNESPLHEFLAGGITTISTDYRLMGKTAALLIMERKKQQVKNHFLVIQRKSL